MSKWTREEWKATKVYSRLVKPEIPKFPLQPEKTESSNMQFGADIWVAMSLSLQEIGFSRRSLGKAKIGLTC